MRKCQRNDYHGDKKKKDKELLEGLLWGKGDKIIISSANFSGGK
jgi:hypothetical protein